MELVRVFAVCSTIAALSTSVYAQQPFSFVLTTPEPATTVPRTDPVTFFAGQDLDPLVGAQSRLQRMTLIAMEDTRFDRQDSRHARQAEFLVDVLSPAHDLKIAVGSGMRHEGGGVDVALARIVVGRSSLGGRMTGNVLFERPLSGARDRMDVITTFGWSRPLARGISLGAETVAEDLEGLWQANEAEGGARLFFGPSVDLKPAARDWSLHLTTGADVRASQSLRSSDALRALRGSGFVLRVSAIHAF
jgi:hypothetical protein